MLQLGVGSIAVVASWQTGKLANWQVGLTV